MWETDVETVVLVPPAAVVEAAVVLAVDPPAGTLVETPWPTQAVLAGRTINRLTSIGK